MLDEPVDSVTSTALREKTAGWITSLRLAVLALHHRSDRDRIMTNLPEESRYLKDYLITLVYNFESIIFGLAKAIYNEHNSFAGFDYGYVHNPHLLK
jgi:hypothetical protein